MALRTLCELGVFCLTSSGVKVGPTMEADELVRVLDSELLESHAD